MRCDYHIHTHYLGCGNGTMVVKDIVSDCARRGIESIAITDHLNSLEFLDKHRPIRKDIEALDAGIDVYFGVEVNFLPDGSLPHSEDVMSDLGFQFAVGGPHETFLDSWDSQEFVKRQHEKHIATCEHPLVQVLAHPWWFGKGEFDGKGFPWLTGMDFLPKSVTRELAHAAAETGTAIEINACAVFGNPDYSYALKAEYVEYLAALAEEGPMFSVSSDAHDISELAAIGLAEAARREAGIPEDRIWHPGMKPFHSGR